MVVLITKLSRSSWFKIKAKNNIIHIDPGYIGDFENQEIPEEELEEKADLILITHFHPDHLQKEALNKIYGPDTIVLAPQTLKNGINGKEIKPNEELKFNNIKIKAVDAYNTPEGSSTKKFHKKGENVGYILSVDNKTIYHAGDTDFIPEMKEFRDIDLSLIPIGGTFTMNIKEAVEAILVIKPKIAIPMHMKDANPEEFKKLVEEKSNIKVKLLEIGETNKLG
ncbi:MAG: MBL fold metallo-hydrolase [Methanobacteriaceae archaeon]|nr:MBL fold metallo-hydrolase [Methanobacteriaceae archaeon]